MALLGQMSDASGPMQGSTRVIAVERLLRRAGGSRAPSASDWGTIEAGTTRMLCCDRECKKLERMDDHIRHTRENGNGEREEHK